MRKQQRVMTLVIAAATAMTLAACGSSDAEGSSANTEFRIIASEPSSGLDPNTSVTQASLRVMELMYDTLIDYDEDNTLIPMIAESWDVSDDGLTYDFQIRENAAFSDGTTITADDVAYSVQRMSEGEALGGQLEVLEDIEVVSDTEVRFTLATASRVFLNTLAATGSAAILNEEAVEGDEDYFLLPQATSGPWEIQENVPQSHATLLANENYWNEGYPQFEKITYTFGTDTPAMATAVETGSADMTYNMVPRDAVRLAEAGSIQYFEAPSPGILAWGLDKTQPPFDDVRVRQALAYMVPRQERLDTCWSGIGPVSFGDQIYEGDPLYVEGEQRFDVPKDEALEIASALLDEVGWVEGDGEYRVAQGVEGVEDGTPFSVEVPYENTWSQARCNTEALQESMRQLGVEITPNAYDRANFWTDVAADKFTMYHAGNNYATTDAYFTQSFTCEGSVTNLIAKWCNEEVDALIEQAVATSDLDEAAQLYRQVQDIILDEQPMITTGAQYAVIGANPDLTGYYPRADASNRALIYASLEE